MNTLTKTQLINLLLNAYGFVDKHDMLFTTDKSLMCSNEFELLSSKNDIIQFSYDDATFVNGTATFETLDGDRESFTVVVAAADPSCYSPSLLYPHEQYKAKSPRNCSNSH